ncbi:hypothetical protein JAAARDRAFT_73928 [Jaapia argillacea MUCL 33604]|uniref:Uncharacterized protein n=1 Tax=Jaapia argillacea MUCL 33604 TaxID=933084 RepID=A0A067P8B3_9AGAM|nr:hypothetical protein JAAARDRAFT_73928 [Jaapia argillacea MUCL 33604]
MPLEYPGGGQPYIYDLFFRYEHWLCLVILIELVNSELGDGECSGVTYDNLVDRILQGSPPSPVCFLSKLKLKKEVQLMLTKFPFFVQLTEHPSANDTETKSEARALWVYRRNLDPDAARSRFTSGLSETLEDFPPVPMQQPVPHKSSSHSQTSDPRLGVPPPHPSNEPSTSNPANPTPPPTTRSISIQTSPQSSTGIGSSYPCTPDRLYSPTTPTIRSCAPSPQLSIPFASPILLRTPQSPTIGPRLFLQSSPCTAATTEYDSPFGSPILLRTGSPRGSRTMMYARGHTSASPGNSSPRSVRAISLSLGSPSSSLCLPSNPPHDRTNFSFSVHPTAEALLPAFRLSPVHW